MVRTVLTIDWGSTLIKARLFRGGKPLTPIVSVPVHCQRVENRTQLLAKELDESLKKVLGRLRSQLKKVDVVVVATQSPSLTLISRKGELLRPIITHQDRRSYEEAKILHDSLGSQRWLDITGNLPFPGGIAATSLYWLKRHEASVFSKAHTFGSLSTFLIQRWTGNRVMDPANASFMGLYNTCSLGGWNLELAALVGVPIEKLPAVEEASKVAGHITTSASRSLGIRSGVPVLVGTMDTSAAALGLSLASGEILHVAGTTDVLATLMDEPKPSVNYLTRAFGIGRKWLAVRTLSAGGASLKWFESLFDKKTDWKHSKRSSINTVMFDPYLAGDRLSIDPKWGAFANLTLATTRFDLRDAVIAGIRAQSLEGIDALTEVVRPTGKVWYTGGNHEFARVLHQAWKEERPRKWQFRFVPDLALKGLARMGQDTRMLANLESESS